MSSRIYFVVDTAEGGAELLVRATSQAQAIRHAARNRYRAAVAGQEEIVRLLGAGAKVEDATGGEPDTADAAA